MRLYINNIIQYVIPIFVIINALGNFINNGSELVFSYPKASLKCSLFCALKYGLIYIVISNIMIILLMVFIHSSLLQIIINTIFQEVFFISMSYFFMIILWDSSWTLFIGFSYFIFEFLTKGQIVSFINIYNFYEYKIISSNQIVSISLLSIVMILIGTMIIIKNKVKY